MIKFISKIISDTRHAELAGLRAKYTELTGMMKDMKSVHSDYIDQRISLAGEIAELEHLLPDEFWGNPVYREMNKRQRKNHD